MVEGACLENRCTATYRGFESLTHRIKASIRWLFAFRSGFHPLIPRRFAAAPRGMPAALRFAGCLPVVASLLPPGTRLMALRPFGPQNCLAVIEGGAKERSDCANPSLTAVTILFQTVTRFTHKLTHIKAEFVRISIEALPPKTPRN